jgi:hypothetical protein
MKKKHTFDIVWSMAWIVINSFIWALNAQQIAEGAFGVTNFAAIAFFAAIIAKDTAMIIHYTKRREEYQ